MLERATVIGLQGDLMSDAELRHAASMITDEAAAALGLTDYGLAPGCRADLVVIAAGGVPEAIAAHPRRLLVLHGGRVVGPAPETDYPDFAALSVTGGDASALQGER